MSTSVVHCTKSNYDVYIGRGKCPKTGLCSIWGNPFRIGQDGSREDVLRKYEAWIKTQPHLLAQLPELKDKILGCWCSPNKCHGDILIKLLNQNLKQKPTSKYRFPCGCEFDIVGYDEHNKPYISFDPSVEVNLECERTWNLIGAGNTLGCFQLESQLGQSLASKLKPRNIEHLAALLAIIRPSCLEAMRDKKSVTMHYIDRKNKQEEVTYFHPSLEPILSKTYGEMCYQEQAMRIAKDIAGFTLQESDSLRSALGKKLPEKMAKLEVKFINGCKNQEIVTEEEAKQLFEWIKKGQRYSFNKCVGWETEVEKENGELELICDVGIGDRIKSPFGITTVKNVYNNGEKDVYYLQFEKYPPISTTGASLFCTLDHKILCEDGNQYTPLDILAKNIRIQTSQGLKTLYNISYHGKMETWDLEVDNSQHVYYGNGVAISNSHAVSYAYNTYLSAYTKAHFPRAFFVSYLYYAREKQKPFEEIHNLVQNARLMSINVSGPNFCHQNKHFSLINNDIYFGMCDIKGVGEAAYNKMRSQIDDTVKKINKSHQNWSWIDFLVFFSQNISSTAITAIINSGALSYMPFSRTKMIYEYNIYSQLTTKERIWIEQYLSSKDTTKINLSDILLKITTTPTGRQYACSNAKRKEVIHSLLKTLMTPSYSLEDSPAWIASVEEHLLGIPLTCTSIDACDTSSANCTCDDILKDKSPGIIILPAKIDRVNEIVVKNGKSKGEKMAFLKVSDNSGSIDSVVIFPSVWKDVKKIAFLGNNVLISGERDKQKNSLFVKQMWQL